MILAIDESGSFTEGSQEFSVFAAVHLRQRKTLYKMKREQFAIWENSLPRSLKNSKGEIKSSSLSDEQLLSFCKDVLMTQQRVAVTPIIINPSENPARIVEKHQSSQLKDIEIGIKEYAKLGKPKMAKSYEEFRNWFAKLNYSKYLKLFSLGNLIVISLSNALGHSIANKYDNELVQLKFMIDRDFIKEPRHNAFWRELLRSQIYHASKMYPLPLLNTWARKGHPFLAKYSKDGELSLGKLFWERCTFDNSHENFEIRMADAICTIISRNINRNQCEDSYKLLRFCFIRDRRVTNLVLNDFDISKWSYKPEDNPWLKLPNQALLTE